jgi:hypothetical protein
MAGSSFLAILYFIMRGNGFSKFMAAHCSAEAPAHRRLVKRVFPTFTGTPEFILFLFPFSLMRKETKNPCPTAAVRREGKTLPVLSFRLAGKLLPALTYCWFFKQSRQSPFAEKLHNSPFTQLRARLPIAPVQLPIAVRLRRYLSANQH